MRGLKTKALAASLAIAGATLGLSVPVSQAAVPQFTASLAAANEVTTPASVDAGASGDALISVRPPTTICYSVKFFGLATAATGLHLHLGNAGTEGPMAVPLTVPAATSGETSGCTTTDATIVSQILNDPSGFYVNLHDTTSPAGAARGQLQAATADLSATSLTFGSAGAPIPQGTLSASQAVTVTNNGAAPLVISGFVFGGSNPDDFIVGSDTCHAPIGPSSSCTVLVRFAPQAQGTRSATLTVSSSAPASPLISLQGTAGPLPQGPRGAAGPPGKAGQIRLVTCRMLTVKVRGHKVRRRRCTTKVITGAVKFTVASAAHVSLVRRGVLYATGTTGRAGFVLHARRPVGAGRYTLRLRYRRGHRLVIASAQVTVA